MEKTIFVTMKTIKLFWAWLNYNLSYWTHNNKAEYQYKLWLNYQNLKRVNESKTVNYTHTLKQSEL